MFINKINVLKTLTLFVIFGIVIKYGAAAIIDGPRINITFCGNCSDTRERNVDSIVEKFSCHAIGSQLEGILNRITIQSAPKFATCIILYNNENCTGRNFTVNGNDIKLEWNIDFLRLKVSSYEFCSLYQLRTQKTKKWNATSQDSVGST